VDKVKNFPYVMEHIRIIIMERSHHIVLIKPNLRNQLLVSVAVGMGFISDLFYFSHYLSCRYSQNVLTGSPLCDGTHRKIPLETQKSEIN
jgi:hypothetical protein